MSDPRWTDVDADIDHAILQIGNAVRAFDRGGFDSPDLDAVWERSNAFLHGMETGYSLLEAALEKILSILKEKSPVEGQHSHRDLVERVSRQMTGVNARPAIIDADLKKDLLELLRMRHRARKVIYDDFDASKAGPSVEAARRVLIGLRDAIAAFKAAVDPEPGEDDENSASSRPRI
ncbi:hypothetical protein E0H22_02250 [Rhodopseudomonas boonkerdii]|jgi:hypothetical protein|uniref:ribonuclease toxin HepT-like protein n=1 Tax=Nitrobacteraceae TaxID=41294 RepID=UPI000AFF61C7|nr:hypothetical protein [Rhodopseudomonas boonkerdii]MBN9584262.1 hypothetical protein [Afipia sp.]UGV24605.1 hypothetical protein E0H22_02250 [Rhodopseudomonas boonkerdii]